jgi:hypothetical protein
MAAERYLNIMEVPATHHLLGTVGKEYVLGARPQQLRSIQKSNI